MTTFKGQTKRPNKTKNENAITLVALIITIIILIILAAVTINTLTHDGIADMAIKGAQDFDKAQSHEMNMLNEIDAMVKETIKNIETGTVTPPSPDAPAIESVTLAIQGNPNGNTGTVVATVSPENAGVVSYKFEYKLGSESDYKLGKEIGSSAKSCTYTYTDLSQEVVNNLKVTATDHKGNSKEATIDIAPDAPEPMNPNIDTTYGGITVDYTPKAGQVYNTEGKLSTTASGSDEYSGYGFQYFQTSDLATGWQIWGTDDEYIYIISTNPTSKNLTLQGYTGYNNGVTLLDNICDNVFTNKTTYLDSKGQNLKLEQVLAVMSSNATNQYASQYNTAPYSYDFKYPYIWSEYEQSKNESLNNRSKAYGYVALANGTIAKTSKNPYHSAWYNSSLNSNTYWKTGADATNYQTLVLKNTNYWLSSRSVGPFLSGECPFNLYCANSTSVMTPALMLYNGITGASIDLALRPVVSFPTSMYDLDTSMTPAKIVPRS